MFRLVSTSLSAILGRIKEESIDAALQPVEADPLSRVLTNPSIPDTIGKYGTSLQPVEADPLSRVLTKPSIPDTIGKYGTSLQPVEADPLSSLQGPHHSLHTGYQYHW